MTRVGFWICLGSLSFFACADEASVVSPSSNGPGGASVGGASAAGHDDATAGTADAAGAAGESAGGPSGGASGTTSVTAGTGGAPAGSGGSAGAGGATSVGAAGQSAACQKLQAKLATELTAAFAQIHSPGAVIAVATPACGPFAEAAGVSAQGVALTADQPFCVASVTKTYVAAALLTIEAAGALSLDDAVSKWVDGVPNGDGMTLRQVLNHTSGLFDYTADSGFETSVTSTPAMEWAPSALVAIAASHPPYFAPGAGWHYSNTDYIVAGLALEKATGKTAGAALHAQVFDPGNLMVTSFAGDDPLPPNFVHGYDSKQNDVTSAFNPSIAWTAGSVVANASDAAGWARALYGGHVLGATSLTEMLTFVTTKDQRGDYGLGVFRFNKQLVGGETVYGHLGDITGYHTAVMYFPSVDSALVAFVNADSLSDNLSPLIGAGFDVLMP